MTRTTNPSRYQQPGLFQGAPLTKFMCLSTVAFFFILNDNTDLIALNLKEVLQNNEYYRLVMYPLTFASLGEIIFGLASFIPLSKRFEREFGSEAYVKFLCKAFTTATALQCIFQNEKFATGLYPLLGVLMYLYTRYTPRLYPKFASVLGFDFSEKAMTYLLALQIMANQGINSIIPFMSGYASGILCMSKYSPLSKVDFPVPNFILNFGLAVGKAIGLEDLSHAPSYIASSGTRRSVQEFQRAGGFGNVRNRPHLPQVPGAPPVPPEYEPMPMAEEPSEEAIATLTAMGFERDAVVLALRRSDNNVEHAANRLLTST